MLVGAIVASGNATNEYLSREPDQNTGLTTNYPTSGRLLQWQVSQSFLGLVRDSGTIRCLKNGLLVPPCGHLSNKKQIAPLKNILIAQFCQLIDAVQYPHHPNPLHKNSFTVTLQYHHFSDHCF